MINVAIIGASGYTGLELIKILIKHPKFNITYIATSSGEQNLIDIHPSLKKVFNQPIHKANSKKVAKKADLAFLALPHKTSMSFAKELLSLDIKVVDLSADYRLKLKTYEKFYTEHTDKKNLKNAIYGLPELNKDLIKKAKLIANPGCYPTATILGILPFANLIDEKFPIMIDAKSGVSGAGKGLKQTTHYVTINENFFTYSPLTHRHSPEIKEKLEIVSGKKLNINFVPHLLPITRGMLVSCYLVLKKEVDTHKILTKFYKNNIFVRVSKNPVDVKSTSGTNFCDIFAKMNGRTLFVSSSIDNLLRGASSAAIVNANLMSGFDEDLGVPNIAYVP